MKNSETTNISQFDISRTMEHCTVAYFDGIPGFVWYDKMGQRHNEGLNWPKLNVVRDAKVELLYNSETGAHSAGWRRNGSSEETDGDL